MSPTSKRIFYSFLGSQLHAYLQFKTAMGYTTFSNTSQAKDLDRYILFRGLQSVRELDEGFWVNWLHSVPGRCAATKNHNLKFARGFFKYLIRVGLAQTNPTLRIPWLKQKPYKPYIYTLKEISQILEGAAWYKQRHPDRLLGWTLETMFFLIYACGLRLGEAVRLNVQDVDFEGNTLSLWKTKFHKERLVPFSPEAAKRLKTYLDIRQRFYPSQSGPEAPFFFHGRRCTNNAIEDIFRKIRLRAGLVRTGQPVPRIHDLRRAFAIHRLYKWYQEGHDLLNKLPLLSTYMGHVGIESTQVYLTICRALLREGSRRFQAAFEPLAQKALGRALKDL